MRKIAAAAAVVTIFLSLDAGAADWKYAAGSESGVYFYDSDSIKIHDDHSADVWIEFTPIKPMFSSKKSVKRLLQFLQINCDQRYTLSNQTIWYFNNGESRTFYKNNIKNFIAPDTVMEGVMEKFVHLSNYDRT